MPSPARCTNLTLSSKRHIVPIGLALAALTGAGPASAQTPAPTRPLSALVRLGRADVGGQAAGGADLSAELRDASGTLRGSAEGQALPLLGFYSLGLADADGNAAPVLAGDRLRVADADGGAIQDAVPALRVTADPATDMVSGSAPPLTAISVTVASGLGFDAQARGATTDAAGAFQVSFAGAYDVQDGGTNLRLDVPRPPFTFRLEQPLSAQLALRLFSADVSGVGPNGAVVEAELERSGRTVARDSGSAPLLGLFRLSLARPSGDPGPVEPGDTVVLRFPGIAEHRYAVPVLTADADPATDTVSGQAPAGQEVVVTTGAGAAAVTVRATADAAGRYSASLAPGADLAPGSVGQVQIVQRQSGLVVTLSRGWALTRIEALLGGSTVTGVSAPEGPITLVLRSAAGAEKGRAAVAVDAGNLFAAGGAFTAELADPLGRAAVIQPEDRLSFRQGAEAFELRIPAMTAEVDIGQDRVAGQAPTGAPLSVSARTVFNTQTQATSAGADGRYLADFKGRLDIQGGSRVDLVFTDPSGHRVRLVDAASSIRVWPELGRVDGTVPGGTDLTVTARDRLGLPQASATTTSDFLGRYQVLLQTPGGAPYDLEAGETIEIAFDAVRRTMVVPAMGIDWDTAKETVSGEATAGGTITIVAQPPAGQGNGAVSRTAAVADTAFYSAPFAPDMDLRAGSRLQLTYTYANGDRSRVDRAIPWLNAQVGGNAVGGLALPRAPVTAELARAGRRVGTGQAGAGVDQRFDLRLAGAGAEGQPMVIEGGDTLEARFGRSLSVAVPPLSARLERAADPSWVVRGTGPISRGLSLRLDGGGNPRTVTVQTDAAGAWSRALPGGLSAAPGLRAEVSMLDAEGHRFYSLDGLTRITAYLGGPTVGVEGRPMAPASARLSAAAGGDLGSASGTLDTAGAASLELRGASPTLGAGQSVTVSVPGSGMPEAQMTVAALELKLDTAASRVTGRVPAPTGFLDRLVALRVHVPGEAAPRAYTVLADDQGAFTWNSLQPGGQGPGGLPLIQASRVELVFTGADGHRTVLGATPRMMLFLPRLAMRQ